jgi:hypothetical protein
MAMTLDGSNGVTFNDASLQGAAASPFGLKNRIINGDMRIDQRNAGAAVTCNNNQVYAVDRFYAEDNSDGIFTVQQVADAPSGFLNSLKATITTADASLAGTQYASIAHQIEGYNFADFNFGTATAKTFTLSFWVKSSLTGTFGGSFRNSADNRNYPFSYTISTANTWEQKTITVAGDTTGTWVTNNGIGLKVWFSLGAGSTYSGTAGSWQSSLLISTTGAVSVIGTLSATFQITGVQLEVGSTATPFERRLYDKELASCQRYFYKVNADAAYGTNRYGSVFFPTTTIAAGIIQFPVTMRTFPTGSYSALSDWTISASVGTLSVSAMSINTMPFNGEIDFTVSGATAGQGGQIRSNANTATISFSAEL